MAHDLGSNPPPRNPWHGVTLPIPRGYVIMTDAESDETIESILASVAEPLAPLTIEQCGVISRDGVHVYGPRKVTPNTYRPALDASQGGDNRHTRRATLAKARKGS